MLHIFWLPSLLQHQRYWITKSSWLSPRYPSGPSSFLHLHSQASPSSRQQHHQPLMWWSSFISHSNPFNIHSKSLKCKSHHVNFFLKSLQKFFPVFTIIPNFLNYKAPEFGSSSPQQLPFLLTLYSQILSVFFFSFLCFLFNRASAGSMFFPHHSYPLPGLSLFIFRSLFIID